MEDTSIMTFFVSIAICISIAYAEAAPRVTIRNGTLEGAVIQSRKGRDFYAFRGIPYARPPLGELRFQPPLPPAAWHGVLNATVDGPNCLEQSINGPLAQVQGSEDCLYINVYTPKSPGQNYKRYAVMVYFYGGIWVAGASLNYRPNYLMDFDIVLVTMNFRLGPLGFLSTADHVIPGNYAMKDKVQALRWIRENIGAFGGDPKRVTIVGHSSGGAAVNHLMLSPLARGYFHQVITQSATSLNPFTFNTPAMARTSAKRLGRELNCSTATSEALLACLRTKSAEDITAQPINWNTINRVPQNEFLPVVELSKPGAFLTEEPSVLVNNGQYADVPWLNGLTLNEGGLFTVEYYTEPNQTTLKNLNDNFLKLAPATLAYNIGCSNASKNLISHRIRQHYFGNKDLDELTRMDVVAMFSDALMTFASAKSVKAHLHTKTSPVYFYQIAYRGSYSATIFFGDPVRNYGVVHSDELQYMFPLDGLLGGNNPFVGSNNVPFNARDFQMIDIMTTLWTNFVMTGKPVPKATKMLPVVWQPVKTDALESFVIGGPGNFTMVKNIYKETLDFWSELPCRAGLTRSSKNNLTRRTN